MTDLHQKPPNADTTHRTMISVIIILIVFVLFTAWDTADEDPR
jgi:hypothetical protein